MSVQESAYPPTWGLVDGEPWTGGLPSGTPVEIPEAWKLPPSLRGRRELPTRKRGYVVVTLDLAVLYNHPTVRLNFPYDLARFSFCRYYRAVERRSPEPLSLLDAIDRYQKSDAGERAWEYSELEEEEEVMA